MSRKSDPRRGSGGIVEHRLGDKPLPGKIAMQSLIQAREQRCWVRDALS